MSTLTDGLRETFTSIADTLIPKTASMPNAGETGVSRDMLDSVIGHRPDLREAILRGLEVCQGMEGRQAANHLNENDPEAFGAISLAASAGYFMNDDVRGRLGYSGQESRPDPNPDATPPYVENGMLQRVIDRGPIFKPTPK